MLNPHSALTRRTFLGSLAAAVAAATAGRTLLGADGQPRRPRVLLKSGWQTVNIGDIGHTPGMLRLLADHLPGVDVALWPNSITGNNTEAMFARHFPKLQIVGKDGLKQAFAESDFLLHGSGPSLVAQKAVAQWRKETGKPWGVIGITLGKTQATDAEARQLFDDAKFAYFRDSVSLKVARDAGIKCPVMDFAPDAAFGVNAKDDEKAVPFLKQMGLEDGKFLCVIPRLRNSPYWVMKKHEPKDQPSAAEDKAKHAENERMKEHDHGLVRPAIIEFARKSGMKVLLCPEDVSHVYVGKEMFLDQMPADVKDKVVWRDRYWLTDEAVAVYSRAFGLLSMDMHSPIMALGNGTPALVCRFKQQTSKGYMWADIGLQDWLFDLDVEPDGSRITAALMAMAADPDAARAKAAKALDVVHARQRAAFGVLGKELKVEAKG
jgi:polysaccharide pyruvyl transferase WcaK-like protein